MPTRPQDNRRIRDKANRLVLDRARNLLSLQMRGANFRSVVQAEEGTEVAGLEAFNIQEPAERIDFNRLDVPWSLVPLALLNEQLLARRYEPTVENEFVLVLDQSRSMAYPLTCYFADAEIGPITDEMLLSTKLWLLKLIAAAFLEAAVASGFLVRIVTFDSRGIRVGDALRRPEVLTELFNPIDRHMAELAEGPGEEEAPYAEVALQMMQRKATFLFLGDFQDAALAWQKPQQRAGHRRMLELFREWGRRRPLLVARINHWYEVRPPQSLGVGRQLRHPLGDRMDEPPRYSPGQAVELHPEARKDAVLRLQAQQQWEAILVPALRATCRGFLAIRGETPPSQLARDLRQMWSRFVER